MGPGVAMMPRWHAHAAPARRARHAGLLRHTGWRGTPCHAGSTGPSLVSVAPPMLAPHPGLPRCVGWRRTPGSLNLARGWPSPTLLSLFLSPHYSALKKNGGGGGLGDFFPNLHSKP